jgi:cytochrome c oxidase subunit 4
VSTDTSTDAGHLGPDGDDPDGRHMGHLDEGHTHGPTDSQYFGIFWVLFGITALEVSTYFWESWFGETDAVRRAGVAVLLILMLIKFVMIAGFFMHLRFDSALLRRIFIFGLLVAMAVYTVAMTVMNIWTDNGNPWFDDPPPAITTTTVAEGG